MPVDERVRYVESVCAALIDDRFGRRMSPFLINMRELQEFEEEVFCELAVDGPVPCYTLFPDPEVARRYAAAVIRCELNQLRLSAAEAHAQQRSPSNLGRDSPKISLGRSVSEPPAVAGG